MEVASDKLFGAQFCSSIFGEFVHPWITRWHFIESGCESSAVGLVLAVLAAE
jgi:hypothetical protein